MAFAISAAIRSRRINADFRIFADMIKRWSEYFGHVPGAQATVKEVVREWVEALMREGVGPPGQLCVDVVLTLHIGQIASPTCWSSLISFGAKRIELPDRIIALARKGQG